jgi:hypothetical protein
MPAIVKIQTVETLSHVSHLCDYLGDASHPRHSDIVISGGVGLNCSSKAEFIESIEAAESRRTAKKVGLLSAKALHLLGGTTPGLLLNDNERSEVLKALLAGAPNGLLVLAVSHGLPAESCEDFHIVISGYNAAADDAAFRFPTGLHPLSFIRRQLDQAISKIESARAGGKQPRLPSTPWHLNRKRKPKHLLEQVAVAAASNPQLSLADLLQDKLHFPIVSEKQNSFQLLPWYKVKPVYVPKEWKTQLEIDRQPQGEVFHGLVEPVTLQKAEEFNVL